MDEIKQYRYLFCRLNEQFTSKIKLIYWSINYVNDDSFAPFPKPDNGCLLRKLIEKICMKIPGIL